MILVTGTTGLLGSAVMEILARQGIAHAGTSREAVNLKDPAATRDFIAQLRPTAIIHTAARVHGLMGNRRFPAEIFDENLLINQNVIAAGHAAGVRRFAVASTVAAYPGDLVTDIREDQYLMGEPHAGESAYAHAKRAMLAQLEAYRAQYGTGFSYAIFTNLYGPRDRFDTENGHVVPSLVAKFHTAVREGSPVHVWGRGRARRDFLYIEDAAAALVHLAGTGEGRFNVATGLTLPIARVVEILSEITGVTDIVWQHDRPEGQLDRSYDVTRLRESGFVHRFSLEEGLRATYEWYAAHYPNVRTS